MAEIDVERLPVVHDLYCTPTKMRLKLSGDVYSASSRDCDVASFPWKRGGFKFKVKGVSNKKTLKDTAGEVIGTLTQTHVPSVAHAVEISGPGSSFIVKKAYGPHEAAGHFKLASTQEVNSLHLYGGHWPSRKTMMYMGKQQQGGKLMATAHITEEVSVGTSHWELNVEPGVDVALCVLLCLALDEFHDKARE